VGEAALRPLRPGDATRLRFQVVDSQTGVGVPAALGVVMIDEALLALRPLRPGLLRAYFTLGAAAKTASERRKLSPNKLTLDALVERGSVSALEQQAAQFLLSGAVAPWNASWMTDPWEARKKAQAAIDKRGSGAVHRFAQLHPDQMGERVAGQRGAWRYRSGLPELMKQAGLLSDAERLDAWRRPVQTDRLVLVSHLPPFEEHADSLLDLKLTAVYRALNKLLLDDVDAKNRPRASDGSVIISEEDLARLGNISLVDPWGTALRIQVRKSAHSVGRLRSKSVIYSAGPDGVFGSADDRFPSSNLCYRHSCPSQHHGVEVVGVSASNAFAKAQIGCGCAYGSAYGAALMGSGHRMSRTLSIGSVTESLAAKKDSVRSHFPETLLFRPQLLTDEKGQASLDVTMADSITTWRLFADAVAQDGRLGSRMMGIAVQQDFFVDVDVPAVITQHDELAIPVPIFNHLNVPQKVTLTLMQAPWFDAQGPLHETIELAPSQSTVRYFRIKAQHVGRNVLRVSARGSVLSDAVERRVEVLPDGTEHVESTQQRLMGQPVSWNVSVPAMVIPGTRELTLKLYHSSATHVMEGLDALLRIALAETGTVAREPVDLTELVASVAELYGPVSEERGIGFEQSIQAGAMVHGSRQLLAQALANLLDNAIKFTPRGGHIRFALRACADGHEVSIADDGPGIPPDKRELVLGRRVRLDEARELPGSGLGLSLVAAVTKLHGAQLRLEGAEPGLRVVLKFPA
jgi:signal transduction histidine kinase